MEAREDANEERQMEEKATKKINATRKAAHEANLKALCDAQID